MSCRGIVLVNLVNGKVLRVDVGLQLGLKGCSNAAQAIPRHPAEEGVLFDFAGPTDTTEAVLGVTNESERISLESSIS